ncbi:MAG: LLM class flavin-dependent oxidoreductase [Thaumarchaeota archaeon]|nr:LLM class flavin-dependent oxidoreductase [Nitrososphaerota archaeon]
MGRLLIRHRESFGTIALWHSMKRMDFSPFDIFTVTCMTSTILNSLSVRWAKFMSKIRFGARIPTSGPTSGVKRIIESTKQAEDLGYDAVWDMDHIHNSFERHKQYPVAMGSHTDRSNTLEPNQFETVSTFSFLSGMTRKLRFGVGVMPVLLRDPIVLAKEIATLDALSGGRFIFGVGVSNISDKPEFETVGKPFLSYAERYAMLTEYISAMKAIWTKPTASFHGKYVNFDDLCIYPKPSKPHVPILIGCYTLAGGIERPAVKFAVEHADGSIYGFLIRPDGLRAIIRDFNSTAKKAGRNLSKFDWCFQLRMSTGKTESEARKNCEWIVKDQQRMSRYAGYMWNKQEEWRKVKGAEDSPKSNIETAAVGTPSKILKEVEAFVEAGATSFDLWFMYPRYESLISQMKLFAKEVMPSFN